MAETRIVGNDGAAAITGHQAKLNTWSATVSQVVSDVSAFGDTWRRKKGGIKEGRFSAGGIMSFDAASTAPNSTAIAAAGASVTLTAATGCTLGGTAVLGNVNFTSTQGGDAGVTFDGEFDDTVTETWDESA